MSTIKTANPMASFTLADLSISAGLDRKAANLTFLESTADGSADREHASAGAFASVVLADDAELRPCLAELIQRDVSLLKKRATF